MSAWPGVLLRTPVYVIAVDELLDRVAERYLLVTDGFDNVWLVEIARNALDLLTSQVMLQARVERGVEHRLINVTLQSFAIPVC